ncbi:hypothetical protein [Shimia sediminis]|uniref:hypothetical protein n=1 Tax=Shimia sediminis TaxID=2497945 RepID=UPI000F8EFBC3|nr:hypothetical protein [Shimia sediminis]
MKTPEKREVTSPQAVFLFVYSREASGEMWPTKIRVISSENGSHKVWESEIKPDPSWPQGDYFDRMNNLLAKAPEAKKVSLKVLQLLQSVKQGVTISYHAKGDTEQISRLMDLATGEKTPTFTITDETELSDHQKENHKSLLKLALDYYSIDVDVAVNKMTEE